MAPSLRLCHPEPKKRAAPLPGDGEAGVVGLFERSEEFDALAHTLDQLHFGVRRGLDAQGKRLPLAIKSLTAAIVSDRIAAPLELCAQLSGSCPTILIAPDVSFNFQLAAVRSHVDAILPRPTDTKELGDWLEHFAGQRQAGAISVLIVDDDPLLAAVYAEALGAAGMTVRVVSDPADVLPSVNAMLPDLVLMDIQMPRIDGIELARMIRQSRRHLSLPILFLSAELDADRQLEARKFGGDDFIIKPIEPQRLVKLVRLRAERAGALRAMMERDSLTGLYNHGRFKERLAHELERSRRVNSDVSLAMIDIDMFKRVNDSHGHLVGDSVIRALANTFTSGLRKIDVVGRYGGEEFALILLETPPQAAREVINKLRRRFAKQRFEAAGTSFTVTFSTGVAGNRGHATVEEFIAAADAALYAAKRAGRDRVVLADGSS